MFKVSTAILTLGLVAAPFVQAEPGRVQKWLMDEPMSLFDWGIYQLDKQLVANLKATRVFKADVFVGSARYDWSKNQIILNAMFTGTAATASDDSCVEHIKLTKGAFLDFTWDEKKHREVAPQVMGRIFSHAGGYKSSNEPGDVGQQLAATTVVEVNMLVPRENGFDFAKKCSTTLMSPSVSVIRN